MTDSTLRDKVESFLHINWAFKDVHGKPGKIIIEGYPKGGYHLSYNEFIDRLMQLITAEKEAVRREHTLELARYKRKETDRLIEAKRNDPHLTNVVTGRILALQDLWEKLYYPNLWDTFTEDFKYALQGKDTKEGNG